MKYLTVKIKTKYFSSKDTLLSVLKEIENSVSYDELIEYFIKSIKDFFHKAGKSKAVVGLSGGIDSSLTLFLLIESLGKENIIPVYLPYLKDKSAERNILKLKEFLGLKNLISVNINSFVDNLKNVLDKEYKTYLKTVNFDDKIRTGNIASRLRVNIFYDVAKVVDGLVIGTGIKTEFLLGYSAKYGTPFSCDFGVLNDLYKIDIYNLANILNIPEEIINSTPTTGYYYGHSHEEELGVPLFELDAVLFLKFEKALEENIIKSKYNIKPELIDKVNCMYLTSKHKRLIRHPYIKVRRNKR